ncbi:integrase catalytic domain-containing protein [Trichonephila clavipes]|nr:integrase catalytic domain-containing protein [Trichonephila clavipes]
MDLLGGECSKTLCVGGGPGFWSFRKAQGGDVLRFTDPGTKFKLPNIELPTFDGNPRDWLNFWTQFEKIHDDVNIDDRDKFQYLIQSTAPRSSPREIVESFPATAANYKKAIEYLKEIHGNISVLIQVYIRDLLQLVMAKNKSDISSLYDKMQTRIHALDSLGLTKDKYAYILFPLVESALPADIVKLWERQRHLSTDKNQSKTDLDLLMEFIKNEADSEFRVKIAREIFHPDKVNNKKNVNQYSESKAVVSTACELLTANDNSKPIDNSRNFKKFDNCIFCDKLHASESCDEVSNMKLKFKKDILKRKNACFVCLKRFQRANQCK